MTSKNVAIRLLKVKKSYVLRHEKPTLVGNVLDRFTKEKFWALKDLSLCINKGEKVGVMGPNGSGKTTMLKIIAGITKEDSGIVETHGRVVSLIDLSAGFHSDLTGYENIFLNGLIIGMSKREIALNLDKIIEFSGISGFIDVPVYTYSSGMKLRLGISVAIHSKPDILLMDEGVMAGDVNFIKKINDYVLSFPGTIVAVSHWKEFLSPFCTRYIYLS